MSGTSRHRVLAFIAAYIGERGFASSYREVAGGFGLRSTSSVDYQLGALEARGLLSRGGHGTARALALTDEGWRVVRALSASIARHPAGRQR